MKNKFLLMFVMGLFLTGAYAQESATSGTDYNKWSLEGGIGLTKPTNHFTAGYRAPTPGFFAAELGVRYMLNQYFGMKLNFGYDQFNEADDSFGNFTTNMYNLSFQGVANLGRMMKFETWTRTFNLLAHGGVGVGFLDYDVNNTDADYVGNILGGFTLQVKLSQRVSLYGDVTGLTNYRQNLSFDGGTASGDNRPAVINGTVGLSIALGKGSEHADWYLSDKALTDAFDSRLSSVEKGLKENSAGDRQLAGRVNELSSKVDDLDRKVSNLPTDTGTDPNELIAKLINDGYVNIYFDFNSTKIKGATGTMNILRTYLVNNPDVTVDLLGYADERGTEEYNLKLSQKRADAVAEMLVNAGVDPSRLNAQGKGEDISLDKTTPEAYQLARRVTFVIR